MNINWVLADDLILDPTVNLTQLKDIGSLWGSWKTWRACQTDNVICHNAAKAQELMDSDFTNLCNFYISHALYSVLDAPPRVQVYGGDFMHDVDRQDEIVAMHLAAITSDIILLLGFNWQPKAPVTDPDVEIRIRNYRNLVQQAIVSNPKVQWVLVDAPGELIPELAKLDNLTHDTLTNVLKMLAT